MRIKIWGSRGSLPSPMNAAALQEKLVAALLAANGRNLDTTDKARAFMMDELDFAVSHTFGGNSPCVQIDAGGNADASGNEYVLCDLGSGARVFGNHMLRTHGAAQKNVYHVFMSHMHWDHIMGFPFFTPAYIAGNHIRIYGCHDNLEAAFRRQHAAPSFPVDFSQLAANIEFVRLTPGIDVEVIGIKVSSMLQAHSGDSYCYRFERGGKSAVYSTDAEHKPEEKNQTRAFADFFRDADLVIFDSMYSLADAVSVKEDWGHSSNITGVELCQMAGAKRLCLFHHEPIFGDQEILNIWRETRRFEEITRSGAPLEILSAYDGLEITL
jgi:phosphoribosyl 1,2-cyclic phosphodiesterase